MSDAPTVRPELPDDSEAFATRDLFGDWWWMDANGFPIRGLTRKEWETVQNTQVTTWTLGMVKKTAPKS